MTTTRPTAHRLSPAPGPAPVAARGPAHGAPLSRRCRASLLGRTGPLGRVGAGLLALGAALAPAAPAQGPPAPQAPASPGVPGSGAHDGPRVAPARDTEGLRGPARHVGPLLRRFPLARALEDTIFLDGFHRTPASPAYDACLDRLAETLRGAGFGTAPNLTLRFLETEEPVDAWWPEAGLLELLPAEGPAELLLGFASPGDAHRTLLPVGCPDADVTAEVTFELDRAEGRIYVTDAPLSGPTVGRARSRGALAVLSAGLFPFTVDPEEGGERHLDAILFTSAPRRSTLPVGQISPRVRERLHAAPEGTRVRFHARGGRARRPLRTLVAEIVGTERPGEAVVLASHVQEPGAGDNAAGAAGLVATAAATARAIAKGELAPPRRTVVFVLGDEMRQSKLWFDERGTEGAPERRPIAAFSADMLGQSQARTGAVCLLERTPDPGALFTLPPDAHTAWGAGACSAEDLLPNGLNVIARAALCDVADAVGGWRTSENPWEGGSDHDVFNRRGVPAALVWHFTDFTYHTNLDRLGMIDPEELRRTATALGAAALDLASPGERDVERHLASLELERALRVSAAEAAGEGRAVDAWDAWCDGAADWLHAHALGSGTK